MERIEKQNPLVSLVLTTFNSVENLHYTMESIAKQDYPKIQVVIKDGGSTDGTVEKIKEYEKNFPYPVIWEKKGDQGIYEAMNQGYALATGEILAFFNDCFVRKDAVSLIVSTMLREQTDGAHADLIYATDQKVVRYWHMGQGHIQQGWMPGHPTLYLRREIYEKYGLFKTQYRVSADYELMVRILKDEKVNLSYVPEVLVRMFYGGTSTSGAGAYWQSLREGHKALVENGIKRAWLVDLRRSTRLVSSFLGAGKVKINLK